MQTISDWQQVKNDLNLSDNDMDSHETDLYIRHTPERAKYFKDKGFHPSYFTSQIDRTLWFEVTFYLIDDKIAKRR